MLLFAACCLKFTSTIENSVIHFKRYYKQAAGKELLITREEISQDSHKVKVKFILEQATKAQRGSRGIAVLFL
jgi:hypothetical protein